MNFEADMDAIFNTAELAIEIEHYFLDESEKLVVIFDEASEVVFDKGEFAGAEANVPMITLPKNRASNISHSSTFYINAKLYGVIEITLLNSGVVEVYLDNHNG